MSDQPQYSPDMELGDFLIPKSESNTKVTSVWEHKWSERRIVETAKGYSKDQIPEVLRKSEKTLA